MAAGHRRRAGAERWTGPRRHRGRHHRRPVAGHARGLSSSPRVAPAPVDGARRTACGVPRAADGARTAPAHDVTAAKDRIAVLVAAARAKPASGARTRVLEPSFAAAARVAPERRTAPGRPAEAQVGSRRALSECPWRRDWEPGRERPALGWP